MLFNKGSVLALSFLVLQNAALAILLKLTFRADAKPYSPSTAVLCAEVLKLTLCLLVVARKSSRQIYVTISQILEQKLLFLPALLYVIQNNLLFFSSKRLTPVVYIICAQMKIFTSAGFSWIILGNVILRSQYISLLFLCLGIVVVQAQDLDLQATNSKSNNSTAGCFAAILASVTSGLAGVVLEKVYKDPEVAKGMKHTVWTRNIQLSLISILFALSGVYMEAREQVLAGKFFNGYDHVVWTVILLQAAGGIIVAFVLKFADVIMKCIAVSCSICCCAVYSVWTNELSVTVSLVFSVILVNASVVTYSLGRYKGAAPEKAKTRADNI